MYYIVVKDDHTLSSPRKERIMQRSKLVDSLCFLVKPYYNDMDIATSTVMLEYVLPVSKKYCTEYLSLSEEMYEDYLKYELPFNTKLTQESGKIEIQLTFVNTNLVADGQVRKTSTTFIDIIPIAEWSNLITDSALTALDQRIVIQDAQIKALANLSEALYTEKADNIEYDSENNELQLLAGDKKIGDRIMLRDSGEDCKNGVPVVDFGSSTDESEDDGEIDNVVEFYESPKMDDEFNNVVQF